MLAYVSSVVVAKYINLLDRVYKTKDLLSAIRGKLYEYLGIIIDFSLKLGVSYSQYDLTKKLINNLPDM